MVILLIFIINFFSLFLYIKIANKLYIFDTPNFRSSHTSNTVRGGGIIFPLAALLFLNYISISHILFALGLLTISILSFIDDIKTVDSKIRLFIQGIAVAMMVYPFLKMVDWYFFPFLFILTLGVINAYNFMDGVNGITVLYSIVTIGSLYWISSTMQLLQQSLFFSSVMASLVVFSFFNVRKKAICFAGDVGSVSIAFIICYLVIQLILQTQWYCWILLLGVYGIDTVFTIVCRIFRKEPLMKAHRSHFYQYLANEAGLGHLTVSFLYAVVQLGFNIGLIYSYQQGNAFIAITLIVALLVIYIIFRLELEGYKRLLISY